MIVSCKAGVVFNMLTTDLDIITEIKLKLEDNKSFREDPVHSTKNRSLSKHFKICPFYLRDI